MKRKSVIIGFSMIVLVGIVLRFIPLYSKSAEGCVDKDTTVHRSIILGSTKSDIDKEVEEFVASRSAYDCPVATVTYKLFIL